LYAALTLLGLLSQVAGIEIFSIRSRVLRKYFFVF